MLLVAIFLWLQMAGVVHAYEHHHEEHALHECAACLIYKNTDDLAAFPLKVVSICAAKNQVSTAIAYALFPFNSFPYHSRAPPVNT